MSQPYYSVAEGMLGEASIGRNLPGMVSPVRPGANAFDKRRIQQALGECAAFQQ